MAKRRAAVKTRLPGRPLLPEPTEKQLEVFYLLVKFVQDNGYQPNMRELAEMLEISKPSLEKRLVALERKGFIERPKGKTERAFRLKSVRFEAVFEKKKSFKSRGSGNK